jgi:hypothetical protein
MSYMPANPPAARRYSERLLLLVVVAGGVRVAMAYEHHQVQNMGLSSPVDFEVLSMVTFPYRAPIWRNGQAAGTRRTGQ